MNPINTLSSMQQLSQSVIRPINLKNLLTVFLILQCCIYSSAQKMNQPASTGYINFNVQSNSQKSTASQPLSLLACNTRITTADSAYWHGSKGLRWDSINQVLSGIPFGHQTHAKTNKRYYISKYYIASPPVFNKTNAGKTNTLYDIGLVTPDEFVLRGEKPAQLVYLNYDVLEQMYIKYFDVKFDASFKRLGHSLVPFKVECNDFPWTDKKQLPGAKGASGIGALDMNATTAQRLFLPYYFKNPATTDTTYLDCQVTILNDILLDHEIYFIVKGKHKNDTLSTINLSNYKNTKDTIELYCKFRKDLPCGCLEPKAGQ